MFLDVRKVVGQVKDQEAKGWQKFKLLMMVNSLTCHDLITFAESKVNQYNESKQLYFLMVVGNKINFQTGEPS